MSAGFNVVVTDQVFPSVDLEREKLAEIGATLTVASGTRDEVLEQAREADALLNTYFSFDAEALGRLERCRIIARYGIGVDNIDLDTARDRGIIVTNVPDYCVEEVAAHTTAMILSLIRRLPEGHEVLMRGGWGVDELRPMKRLSDVTVGLVGLGRIGRATAAMLSATGVRIIGSDPYVTEADGIEITDFEKVLATSDAVSLHSPLTPETRGMIGAAELAMMQPDAVIVNASRGPLIVMADLIAALRARTIRAAGLDVFEVEPPDPAQLRDVPGLLATPHSAFYSEAALKESQTKAVTQVIRVLKGEDPVYRVNG
jgi:D-3-phosphoglycerate dehydrogenase / 2-oxoglutarate reductase